jgi:hypothetical protein
VSEFDIYNLEINGLYVKINLNKEKKEKEVIMTFQGVSPNQNMDRLHSYLKDVHEKLIENKIENLVLDFFNLQYLDRDGFVEIIKFVLTVKNETGSTNRYNITILYDGDKTWQYNLFILLKNLFPDIVTIHPL